MAYAGESNLIAARTEFETRASIFMSDRSVGNYALLSDEISGAGSRQDVGVPVSVPSWKKHSGSRVMGGGRTLVTTIGREKYEATLALPHDSVRFDSTDSTARLIEQFFTVRAPALMDQIVFGLLSSNATGPDGVSLVNASHPFGEAGGTWDNISALSFGHAAVEEARVAMLGLTDEEGEPLGLRPDTYVVSPADEREALEVAQADTRLVLAGTAGEVSSGAVSSTNITNVYRGLATVIVDPRMDSGDWLVIDSRFKPITLVKWSDVETVIHDQPDDDGVLNYGTNVYAMNAWVNAGVTHPWSVYGKLSA